MLAVVMKGRRDSVLPGFLLVITGFGVVLLVRSSLTATSIATRLGELAFAVALLVLFVRIWRANEGSGFLALVSTLLFGLGASLRDSMLHEFRSAGYVPWFNLVYAVVLLEISVGLWRAHQWARWAAGVASILWSTRFLLMLAGVYAKDRTLLPAFSMPGTLVMFFALFWGAIALYLCLPSTGARFAEMRFARE